MPASASSTQDVSIQPAMTQTAPDYMNIITPRSVMTQSEHGTPSRHERLELDLRGPEEEVTNNHPIMEEEMFPVFAHDESSAKTWCESDDTKLNNANIPQCEKSFLLNTKLQDGRMALLLVIGSVGNLMSRAWAKA